MLINMQRILVNSLLVLLITIIHVALSKPSLDYSKLKDTALGLNDRAKELDETLKKEKQLFKPAINAFIESKNDSIAVKNIIKAMETVEDFYQDVVKSMNAKTIDEVTKNELYSRLLLKKSPNKHLAGIYKNIVSLTLPMKFKHKLDDFHRKYLYKESGLNCKGYTPIKEQYYYMFINLMALEFKGWAVLTHIYSINTKFSSPVDGYTFENHVSQLVKTNENHRRRLKNYIQTALKLTDGISDEFKPCESSVIKPKSFTILMQHRHIIDNNWLKIGDGVKNN